MVGALVRMAFFPKMLTRRSAVGKVWYESNRESDNVMSSSLAIELSNMILLVIMVFIVTGPFFWLPWPERLFDGPFGTVRYASEVVGLHLGLLLLPCAYFLTRILLRQTRLFEQLKLIVLIAVCLWLGWGNACEFVGFWSSMI